MKKKRKKQTGVSKYKVRISDNIRRRMLGSKVFKKERDEG